MSRKKNGDGDWVRGFEFKGRKEILGSRIGMRITSDNDYWAYPIRARRVFPYALLLLPSSVEGRRIDSSSEDRLRLNPSYPVVIAVPFACLFFFVSFFIYLTTKRAGARCK